MWVPAQDVDWTLDFYQNTLSFSLIKREGPWAEIDANGLNIGINVREPQGAGPGGDPVITFQPEGGLDAAVEDLKGKGVDSPAETSEQDWPRVATFAEGPKCKNQELSFCALLAEPVPTG